MQTGAHGAVDEAAQRVIQAFNLRFPGRLRAVYVLGSYADGSYAPTSDLDLTLVFAGQFTDLTEREEAQRIARVCIEQSTIELDIQLTEEATLARGVDPNLKLASALISGQDIRDQAPLISLEAWTRDRMHSSWWRVARLFARPSPLIPPLEYPEPELEFLGYTRRTLRLADKREVPCTRDLIRLIGWAATALLALDCGVYVSSKREVPALYATCIGDEWAGLISDIFTLCRSRWGYLIPEQASERACLRSLCEQTLRFERHFLARYVPYLLVELHGDEEQVHAACEALLHAPLGVPDVQRELRRVAVSGAADAR